MHASCGEWCAMVQREECAAGVIHWRESARGSDRLCAGALRRADPIDRARESRQHSQHAISKTHADHPTVAVWRERAEDHVLVVEESAGLTTDARETRPAQ